MNFKFSCHTNLCLNPLFCNFLRAILLWSWMMSWPERVHDGFCWTNEIVSPHVWTGYVDTWVSCCWKLKERKPWKAGIGAALSIWGMSRSKCDMILGETESRQRLWMACFLTALGSLVIDLNSCPCLPNHWVIWSVFLHFLPALVTSVPSKHLLPVTPF